MSFFENYARLENFALEKIQRLEFLYTIEHYFVKRKRKNKSTMMKNAIAYFSITTTPKIIILCTTSITIRFEKQ